MTNPEDQQQQPSRKRRRRCPICGKPVEEAFRPFCSRRCKDVDLGRWLGGDYRIAGHAAYGDERADEDGA